MFAMKKRLLALFLVVTMFLPGMTPEAEAIGPAVAAYELYTVLAACAAAGGFTVAAHNANGQQLVETIGNLWGDYKKDRGYAELDFDAKTLAGITVLAAVDGAIRLGKDTARTISDFFNWFKNRTDESSEGIYTSSPVKLYYCGEFAFVSSELVGNYVERLGTIYPFSDGFMLNGYHIWGEELPDKLRLYCDDKYIGGAVGHIEPSEYFTLYVNRWNDLYLCTIYYDVSKQVYKGSSWSTELNFEVTEKISTVDITTPQTITLPDTSVMTNEQSVAISTGIQAGTKEEFLEQLQTAAADGTLTATAAIEGTATEEPGTGEVEKPDGILAFLTGALMAILGKILSGIEAIPKAIGGFFDGIGEVLSNIWDTILTFPRFLQGIWDSILTFPSYLQGIWDAIISIPGNIADVIGRAITGVKDWVISLVVPSEAAVQGLLADVDATFPIFNDLKAFGADFMHTMENPSLSASQLALTPFIDLGKKQGREYGTKVINFLDFTWYVENYKKTVDDVIVGFFWALALWNAYGQVSSLLNGGSGTIVSYEYGGQGSSGGLATTGGRGMRRKE